MSLRSAILHEAGWAGNRPRRCWLQPEISQSRPAMVTHGSWTGHQHGFTMMAKPHGALRQRPPGIQRGGRGWVPGIPERSAG